MNVVSVNELTTYRWTFEEDVQHYADSGIAAIGVWRQKLSDFGEEKGIELLRESGLQVSSLLWAGGFTGSDGRSYAESVQDAREAIRLAQGLQAGSLIVYSGGRGGHTRNHAMRLLRGALDEILPLAEQLEVTLAIEPMHPGCAAEWTFLSDLDETLALVTGYARPRLQLAFDTYHFGVETLRYPRLDELVANTAIIQLGDAKSPPEGEQDRCQLGEGEIPLQELLAAFVARGYQGFLDVELMGEEIEVSDYHDLIVRSKQVIAEMLTASQAPEL